MYISQNVLIDLRAVSHRLRYLPCNYIINFQFLQGLIFFGFMSKSELKGYFLTLTKPKESIGYLRWGVKVEKKQKRRNRRDF
ncbi:hypothetical protein E3J84_00575 [Candidatus Aerophobetes bacterium]|uniref:Uncharacterized protein n=1 Tax=Aerophobetes bacterium TaxID=2030807 RepID=A0A523S5D9_UNCAE|nr:MAG: hypothetical protein E3J84_00575 [Candidatus Aerophobetes bacterium]